MGDLLRMTGHHSDINGRIGALEWHFDFIFEGFIKQKFMLTLVGLHVNNAVQCRFRHQVRIFSRTEENHRKL
jgi:hypothetical protein